MRRDLCCCRWWEGGLWRKIGENGATNGLGGLGADVGVHGIDQARAEADPCWSTYSFQGYCCYWRLRRACWPRDQDLQRSRNRDPRRHHHCEAQRAAYPPRVLGRSLGRAAQLADEGEWQVWERYCSRRFAPCHAPFKYHEHRRRRKQR